MADPGHRLTAILAGDGVAYSRLMAADEASTVATLQAHRDAIAHQIDAHSGRALDFTGDAFLAEFPSAVDAVRAAQAIQRELAARNAAIDEERRLHFRLGVHLGDVVSDGETIYGDGVNVAARLQGLAAPGGVCVSGAVHEVVQARLGAAFEDLGEQALKNIPEPVRVFGLAGNGETAQGRHRRRGRRGLWIAASALGLVALALALSWPRPLGWITDAAGITRIPSEPPLPDKPSIVLLPFETLGGEDYFGDGITEDLTTDLSKIPEIFVIGRTTAFGYKDRDVDLKQIGRELGVHYALEGSVRREADRVRINAQLIDTQTGFHIWSERYDRELTDVFALQTEITRAILQALRVELRDAELARLVHRNTDNLQAYETALRASDHMHEFTRSGLKLAQQGFARAVELDPDYADAIGFLGTAYMLEYVLGWSRDPMLVDRMAELAKRALALDPTSPVANTLQANVYLWRGDTGAAVAAARRAVELAPNLDPPHLVLSAALAADGRAWEGLEHIQTAIRINPRGGPTVGALRGLMLFRIGREEEAIQVWEETNARYPESVITCLTLAVAYAAGGRDAEAREMVRLIRELNPNMDAEGAATLTPGGTSVIVDRAEVVRLLRSAGLP